MTLLFKNLFFLFQNVKKCIYLCHFLCIAFAKVASRVDDYQKTLQHVISTDDFSSKHLNCILRSYQIKKIEKRRKRIYLLSIKYCHCFLPTGVQKSGAYRLCNISWMSNLLFGIYMYELRYRVTSFHLSS